VDGACINVMDDEMIPRQHDVQSGAGWHDYAALSYSYLCSKKDSFPDLCLDHRFCKKENRSLRQLVYLGGG